MIKVDRAFVKNIGTNKDSVAIVRAVNALASAIGVPVCVEGIEDEVSLSTVVRLGCQVGLVLRQTEAREQAPNY